MRIKKIFAREVLDSRGNPTIEAEVHTTRSKGRAIIPSGASVGIYESIELRDKDRRYQGLGVRKAVKNIRAIEKTLKGFDVCDQEKLDMTMLALDGTKDKARLGANAILAVSLASARCAANEKQLSLFSYISRLSKTRPVLPVPFANVINGGKHAGNGLAMQEFMIAPVKARSFSEACRSISETYHILRDKLMKKYGKSAINVGDEGGFAPPINKAEEALGLVQNAIEAAGYEKTIRIGTDPAASEFYNGKLYLLHRQYTGEQLQKYYNRLIERFDICSIEDPFDQDDFKNFQGFTKKTKCQVVGDDLLVTNTERIKLARENKLCNALLLKVNQIGSLTESLNAAKLAKSYGWNIMVSHRSGDTEDAFISDLAVGLGTGQIKLGAPCRGERTAKYNQLIRIEENSRLKYAKWNS